MVINSNDNIQKQINEILKEYPKAVIINAESGVMAIQLHQKVKVTIKFGNYPKKPEIETPSELVAILGKPSKFLKTLDKWKPKNNPSVLSIIKEFQAIINANTSTELIISKDLIEGFLVWARDNHPKSVMGFLEQHNGVIDEFILSDKGISRINDWRNGFTNEFEIFGSIQNHPSGNLEPTDIEIKKFRNHKVNVIVIPPYSHENIKLYDKEIRNIPFKIVQMDKTTTEKNNIFNEDIDDVEK
jgi:hypothetical protein